MSFFFPLVVQVKFTHVSRARRDTASNLTGAERKSLRMGEMDYFLHVYSHKNTYYVCLTEGDTIANPAATYGLLDQMKEDHESGRYGTDDENVSGPNSTLRRAISRWNDPNVVKTAQLKSQLKDVAKNAASAVQALLTREEKLEVLVDKAEQMAAKAKEVEDVAKEVYWAMLYRLYKWYALYAIALLILVAIIVAAICGSGNC